MISLSRSTEINDHLRTSTVFMIHSDTPKRWCKQSAPFKTDVYAPSFRSTSLRRAPCMNTLPPELLLYLIPFFPLTTLIAARGVNTQWRSFAQTATLHPTRKALLDLYLAAIAHPSFASLARALQTHVHEFDREAYIANLNSCGCVLPDIFELWVLEWPSKAVHFWTWPGLGTDFSFVHEGHYFHGPGNLLGKNSVTINTIPLPNKETATNVGSKTCQGLGLWEVELSGGVGAAQLWLVVDANQTTDDARVGRLLWTHTYHLDGSDQIGGSKPELVFRENPAGPDTLIKFFGQLDFSRSDLEWILDDDYY